MASDLLPIGLVGCGGMGVRHLRAYAALRRAGVERFAVEAVCDPRPGAAAAAADLAELLLGARPQTFDDHEQLIASGAVVALDIVTDPAVHHLVAIPALEFGLHVICEKPLGITVRACRAMVDAAARGGRLLATAENYRRDGPNRLARAVLEAGLLGEIHLMLELNLGGDDAVLVSPWRHIHEAGSIALDMGVHYTDIFRYYLGDLASVSGSAFIAEPFRILDPGAPLATGIEEVSPGVMRATGADSLVALFETCAGVPIQLSYVPSGPGRRFVQRSVHGRLGSMSVPPDRSGGALVVELGERRLSGAELRRELGGFELEGVAAELFGRAGTEYDLPFPAVDAATIGIELADFGAAVARRGVPEVDGLAGLQAVAAVWAVAESSASGGSVRIAEVVDGTLSRAQDALDRKLGLLPGLSGVRT
ncbi:MAG: Gfo/Idh/MocA family oxidoreductase [Solirubrobacteraceae bacterium]